MVTAETAVLAPVMALCLALGVWMVSLGHIQVRLVDSAREAARMIARGEEPAAAVSAARLDAPTHATFRIERAGRFVTVEVSHRSLSPLPGLSWDLHARSSSLNESR